MVTSTMVIRAGPAAKADALFDPDAQKEKGAGWKEHFGVILSGIKGQQDRSQEIHADGAPDPGNQGIMPVKTKKEVFRGQAVVCGEVEFFKNL